MQKQKIDEDQIRLVAAEESEEPVSSADTAGAPVSAHGTVAPPSAFDKPLSVPGTAVQLEGEAVPAGSGKGDPVVQGTAVEGRYQLISLISSGGMGEVYKARDLASQTLVAIKLIKPERLQDAKALERFQQEARVVSGLSHPNIASVREFGQDADGSTYLVMDYIEGSTLSEILQREGALEPERALRITKQICAGLKQAHDSQIVHRDLKPSNIILARNAAGEERVKILDFGIARILDQKSSAHVPLTETGNMLGTPWYMSPEQCFGQPIDQRTDVYQLGCFLYELLTGKRPFEGINAFEVMYKHVTGTPKLESLSGELGALLERTLNKNPSERYQSMDELLRDLQVVSDIYASKSAAGQEAARYNDLLARGQESDRSVLPRRFAAAALDAVIIAVIFLGLLCCLDAAKLIDLFQTTYFEWPRIFGLAARAWQLAVIDSFLVWPAVLLSLPLGHTLMDGLRGMPWLQGYFFFGNVVPVVLCLCNWLYHTLFECSKLGATPGKIVFGLGVRTGISQTPSFARATQRHFAKAFSMLLLPEVVRFFHAVAQQGLGNAVPQLSRQLRTPIHDGLSKCAVGLKASQARRTMLVALPVMACLLAALCFPWMACYFDNWQLALTVDPNFAVAREARAMNYLRAGKFKEALADFAVVQESLPDRTEIYRKEAAALYQLHDFRAAVNVLQTGIDRAKDQDDAICMKVDQARILAAGAGDFKAALACLQQVPNHRAGEIFRAYLFEQTGDRLLAKAQFKAADEYYGELAGWLEKRSPGQCPDLFLNRAIAANALGREKATLEYLQQSLGKARYAQDHKQPTLVPGAMQAFEDDYSIGSAYLLQGQVHEKSGNNKEARKAFEQAVRSFTAFIPAGTGYRDNGVRVLQKIGKPYLGRAKAYEKLGRRDLAEHDRAAAQNLGVLFDYQCDAEQW